MALPHHPSESWKIYVERERLVSTMNDTKWNEAAQAMSRMAGGAPAFRIKDLRGDELGLTDWDREWYYHPLPWHTIEWLEVLPDGRQDEIIGLLKTVGVPVSIEDGRIRIWGWLRPGSSPRFA